MPVGSKSRANFYLSSKSRFSTRKNISQNVKQNIPWEQKMDKKGGKKGGKKGSKKGAELHFQGTRRRPFFMVKITAGRQDDLR